MTMSTRFWLTFIGAVWFVLPVGLIAGKPVVIKNPVPTHIEKDSMYIPLEKVGRIDEEIDEENFFARPQDIVTDDQGGFFVFDDLLTKVFSFGKDLKLRKVFLKHGQGPYEAMKKGNSYHSLYFSQNGYLYFIAPLNKKIIAFDRQAIPIKEIRLITYGGLSFIPVVDKFQNVYTISPITHGIDVLDKDLKLKYRLLDKGEVDQYLINAPWYDTRHPDAFPPSSLEIIFDVLSDGRLLVYLARASILYIFKEGKLLKQLKIWPERALIKCSDRIKKYQKRFKNNNTTVTMFGDFFVDKDNESFFYLFTARQGTKHAPVYKFDLQGVLRAIYYCQPNNVQRILAKRNQLFYGVEESSVSIFKSKQ